MKIGKKVCYEKYDIKRTAFKMSKKCVKKLTWNRVIDEVQIKYEELNNIHTTTKSARWGTAENR